MDTSKFDNKYIISWYPVAQFFKEQYKIGAFPTYLFFSPDGKIVHREAGFKMPTDFLKLTKEAINPQKQLYTLLNAYTKGQKDYQSMPDLAMKTFNLLHDKEMAFKIAGDYNKNYLNTIDKERLLNKESIEFITWYPGILNSTDRYFRLFYDNSKQVDSVMNQPGFASGIVDGVITREMIHSKIYQDGKPVSKPPNWRRLFALIQQKYGTERAERTILNSEIAWYTRKKDWKNSVKYNVAKIEKYGIDTSFWGRFALNNMIWDVIFKHSDDRKILNKAIQWMETILPYEETTAKEVGLSYYASPLDTYANLLFKVGRVNDAIKWQAKAVSFSPDDKELQDHLEKMKRNEPTW
jgi:tetratricopeptide (TPR) repeat protein